MTVYEVQFRNRLEDLGIDHVSQLIIGFYIVDFCFPSKMLIVELDGDIHEKSKEHDARRDEWLKSVGFRTVRVKNSDLPEFNIEAVLAGCKDCPPSEFARCFSDAHQQYLRVLTKPKQSDNRTRKQKKRDKKKHDHMWTSYSKIRQSYRDEAAGNLERMFRKGMVSQNEYQAKLKKYQ